MFVYGLHEGTDDFLQHGFSLLSYPKTRPSLVTAHSATQYASGDVKSRWKSSALGSAVTSFKSLHLLGKSDQERERERSLFFVRSVGEGGYVVTRQARHA